MLELPRAWEPSDSSVPRQFGERSVSLLCQTLAKKSRVEGILRKLGFVNQIVVECRGRSGACLER